MSDEFEERERSVDDAVPEDKKPSEPPNGHSRWDPTPRVGTVPADAYASSSEPYISSLPAFPGPPATEQPALVEPSPVPIESIEPNEQASIESTVAVENSLPVAAPEP